jgi:hypothetical protein
MAMPRKILSHTKQGVYCSTIGLLAGAGVASFTTKVSDLGEVPSLQVGVSV